MNYPVILLVAAVSFFTFWVLRRAMVQGKTVKTANKASDSPLNLLADQEKNTTVIDSKSMPNATGLYGLSPNNPICCGNMLRMNFTYKRIKFNGVAVFHFEKSQSTMLSKHHVRKVAHSPESDIPDLFFTYDFHYKGCRNEAPEMNGFTMEE